MIQTLDFHLARLERMKKYPSPLFYKGNLDLLQKSSISIVGSRKPNQYARQKTHELSARLSNAGICIVSGGAIGIDAIAHKAAGTSNTIMVAATGLDVRYPSINRQLIEAIENDGLILSQFQTATPSQRYNFVLRNELIVALSDILIVPYADANSGSMRSVTYAMQMGKKIYVLPHRLGESQGTQQLLYENKAEAIYDIDAFITQFYTIKQEQTDPFLEFCKTEPTYEEAVAKFGTQVFEYELIGKLQVKYGKILLT
jgi:DNA processing protein